MKRSEFIRLLVLGCALVVVLALGGLALTGRSASTKVAVVPTLMELPPAEQVTVQPPAAAPEQSALRRPSTMEVETVADEADEAPIAQPVEAVPDEPADEEPVAEAETVRVSIAPEPPAEPPAPSFTPLVLPPPLTPPPQSFPTQPPVQVISPAQSQPVAGQVVVSFAPNTSESDRAAYIESLGGAVVSEIPALDTVVVSVPANVAAASLPESPVVALTEPDYTVSALGSFALPPSDPLYTQQWGLTAIGAPEAWAALPDDLPPVAVAVIDSGICASHADLQGRILPGYDFVQDDFYPQDTFGHGCSVAGIIAANMNDGFGMAGVAPNAKVMPLRVLDGTGIGSYSSVAAALVWAADHGAQVANLSLGGSMPSTVLENAITYAVNAGVTVVAAAGNGGNGSPVLYPAAYESVISVGAVDSSLAMAGFSSGGQAVDVLAPGVGVLTTTLDGGHALVSGTSFAAPHVSARQALEGSIGNITASYPTHELLTDDSESLTLLQSNRKRRLYLRHKE